MDGGATTIVNDSALALQGSVAGNLVATATSGGITDSAVLDITGTTSFTDTADAGINLGDLAVKRSSYRGWWSDHDVNDSELALQGQCSRQW